jgi:3-methyladenine DNA glycosylase AlkC
VKVADIDPQRLATLNAGGAETTTLTECLAVDFAALLEACVPDVGAAAVDRVRAARAQGISRRMALMGDILVEGLTDGGLARLQRHPSDTIRGWACFAIGARPDRPLDERLRAIRPLADDPHFGVREWAWMAVRPHMAAELEAAVALLVPWTADGSDRLRRFASESTRPRGVWCPHLPMLKRAPHLGLPILEPLRADPSAYVQDSVGNWLNDAAKDDPDWVRGVCDRWTRESQSAATRRIRRRAMRSMTPRRSG